MLLSFSICSNFFKSRPLFIRGNISLHSMLCTDIGRFWQFGRGWFFNPYSGWAVFVYPMCMGDFTHRVVRVLELSEFLFSNMLSGPWLNYKKGLSYNMISIIKWHFLIEWKRDCKRNFKGYNDGNARFREVPLWKIWSFSRFKSI